MTAPADTAPMEASFTLDDLRRLARDAVGRFAGGYSTCAYVDWPTHGNVGDSALWLAGKAALAAASVDVRYACSVGNLDDGELRLLVPDGPVLIAGGGNLGDVWPVHQLFRERVIESFAERPVVQLPQSVHFERPEALEHARRVFESHPRLNLLVRDGASLAACRHAFDVPVHLAPDLAFALDPLERTRVPNVDVLWLARTDRESVHPPPAATRLEVVDWVEPDRSRGRLNVRLERHARQLSPLLGPRRGAALRDAVRQREQDALARARLDRGVDLLCRGRVVVTDRLHGHILCCLLGIPHVLLDNSYGKVIALHETWTHGLGLAHVARDGNEALELALELTS